MGHGSRAAKKLVLLSLCVCNQGVAMKKSAIKLHTIGVDLAPFMK